ncbi:thermonuclease family protein [Psychromonas antarctica]|uniref:thermonuclease family protein n=1 Tax=Psychromonas antarctica TaxID=67573 RepID=UPI001EE99BAE|nr:thermonuclease family protein [Psychromonas antarctica]MCG6200807.1 thermonuclease family protein [Psychromonas antarctica]
MRILVVLLFALLPVPLLADCAQVAWDQTVILKQINDGDTVTLENGRLVRFIGINTPEINYRYKSRSDPYAFDAKQLLQRYIKVGDKLHLVFDKTKKDKYGRLLAYVYSKSGRNLALLQLQSGFATHWVIGQNDRFWQCFQQAEQQSRARNSGIWSNFKPLSAANLTEADHGYQYIRGRISDLKQDKRGIRFKLDKKLQVIIHAKQLQRFKENGVNLLLNEQLLLSGKLTFRHGQAKLSLYHPAQILP